ncbi:MAG: RNA polymerase sigma factor [Lysobacterales bacterium]
MDERDAQARIDAALVKRALVGNDASAFEHLVRRHQGLVRAQLRRLTNGDHAVADDLAQETFILAWRKLQQFRGDANFSTWLYRIAYSCFLQHRRSRVGQAEQSLDLEGAECGPLVSPDCEAGLGIDLDAAMRQLSTNQRAALLYCVQLQLSHEQAAAVLGMPLGSVKTHVARGKTKLRALLRDWLNPDERRN